MIFSEEAGKGYVNFSDEFWKEFDGICLVTQSLGEIFKFSNDVYPKIYPVTVEIYERICNSFNNEINKIISNAPKEHKRYLESYLNHIYNCVENSLNNFYNYLEEEL